MIRHLLPSFNCRHYDIRLALSPIRHPAPRCEQRQAKSADPLVATVGPPAPPLCRLRHDNAPIPEAKLCRSPPAPHHLPLAALRRPTQPELPPPPSSLSARSPHEWKCI